MRHINVLRSVLLVVGAAFVAGPAAAKLNLKERKIVKDVQKQIDKHSKYLKEKCGCVPRVKVQWEKLKTTLSKGHESSALDQAAGCVQQFAYAGEKICAEFKKEFCGGIKSLVISGGKAAKTSLKGKSMNLLAAGSGCDGNGKIRRVIEASL